MSDQITEVGAVAEQPLDNSEEVKKVAALIPESEMRSIKERELSMDLGKIPEGGTILDVGCGSGTMGVDIAMQKGASLIQADTHDAREYKVGDLVKINFALPGKEPLNLTEVKADRAIVIDVIHHTGYGNGWNQTENKPDEAGRSQDLMTFITGVATGVKENGTVYVGNSRPEGRRDMEILKKTIEGNEALKDKIVLL